MPYWRKFLQYINVNQYCGSKSVNQCILLHTLNLFGAGLGSLGRQGWATFKQSALTYVLTEELYLLYLMSCSQLRRLVKDLRWLSTLYCHLLQKACSQKLSLIVNPQTPNPPCITLAVMRSETLQNIVLLLGPWLLAGKWVSSGTQETCYTVWLLVCFVSGCLLMLENDTQVSGNSFKPGVI